MSDRGRHQRFLGNNNIQICLNIGCLIEDIDKFVCLLIQKLQDDKFVQYKMCIRDRCKTDI